MTRTVARALLSAALLATLPAASARAADVNVFAAASLTDALKEVSTAYEKSSGDRIVANLGASSALVRPTK